MIAETSKTANSKEAQILGKCLADWSAELIVKRDVAYRVTHNNTRDECTKLAELCFEKIDGRLEQFATVKEHIEQDVLFLIDLYKSATFQRRRHLFELKNLPKAEEALRTLAASSNETICSLTAQLESLQQTLNETAHSISLLFQENNELRQKQNATAEMQQDEQTRLQEERVVLDQAIKTSEIALREKFAALWSKNAVLERESCEKEDAIEELRKTNAELKAKVTAMQDEYEVCVDARNYTTKLLQAEMAVTKKLQINVDEQQVELETIKKHLKAKTNLDDQAEALFALASELKAENASLKKETANLQRRVEESDRIPESRVESLETQVELRDLYIETLLDEKREALDAAAEEPTESLKSRVESLETQVELRDQYIETLLDEKRDAAEELDEREAKSEKAVQQLMEVYAAHKDQKLSVSYGVFSETPRCFLVFLLISLLWFLLF